MESSIRLCALMCRSIQHSKLRLKARKRQLNTNSLTERLSALKVIMRESTIDSFSAILEAIPDTSIIVNATGLGARHLKGVEDAAVYPVRGQTILARAPKVDRVTKANCECSIPSQAMLIDYRSWSDELHHTTWKGSSHPRRLLRSWQYRSFRPPKHRATDLESLLRP